MSLWVNFGLDTADTSNKMALIAATMVGLVTLSYWFPSIPDLVVTAGVTLAFYGIVITSENGLEEKWAGSWHISWGVITILFGSFLYLFW